MQKCVTDYSYPRSLRLIKSEDYGVLARTRNALSFGLAAQYFTLSAVWRHQHSQPLRFGVTVGKKQAPRSVDRQLVKRIIREGLRHEAKGLKAYCPEHCGIDVVVRLRAPLGAIAYFPKSRRALKACLHADLQTLLQRLHKVMQKGPRVPLTAVESTCGLNSSKL